MGKCLPAEHKTEQSAKQNIAPYFSVSAQNQKAKNKKGGYDKINNV